MTFSYSLNAVILIVALSFASGACLTAAWFIRTVHGLRAAALCRECGLFGASLCLNCHSRDITAARKAASDYFRELLSKRGQQEAKEREDRQYGDFINVRGVARRIIRDAKGRIVRYVKEEESDN